MLPPGKYVVEMVVPPGYELVKEEDKNILIGDTYIAPVTQQFAGLGNIFIMPDQAAVAAYNANNPQIPTTDVGAQPRHEGDTGSVEVFWPCVGAQRIVPDFISLFPQIGAERAVRRSDRGLSATAKKSRWKTRCRCWRSSTSSPRRTSPATYTGIITDDFTSEFDPFSPRSARSSRRLTCRFRSRIGPATKSPACTPISGESSTA